MTPYKAIYPSDQDTGPTLVIAFIHEVFSLDKDTLSRLVVNPREFMTKIADTQQKISKPLFQKCINFTRPQEIEASGYYPYFRQISSAPAHSVIINGREQIMIGSNNYLGLTTDPRVKEACIEAVKKYGSGCTGSRFLNGTLDLHVKLEEELAEFLHKEAALVFSTGFQTNLGTISCLVDKGDTILTDRSDHASIVDGTRLSFGKTYKFAHNDMDDLARVMRQIGNNGGRFIVVDGVFSMEGDIVKLPELVEVADEFDAVGAGGDGELQPAGAASGDELGRAGQRAEAAADDLEVYLVRPLLVVGHVQPNAVLFGHAAEVSVLAGADERQEVVAAHRSPVALGEHPPRGLADKRLGIAEHAVHVKDHAEYRLVGVVHGAQGLHD